MMLRTVLLTVSGLALSQAIFFGMGGGGGGGGGCCCGCGTPQPASCGCGPPPCPAAPACPVCPAPQPCPPPPQAYCPQVQPVYIGGGCGGGGCGGGCSGGGCGGGGGGCGGGGCGGGGGGYATSGGGYATSGGGYATGGGGYATGGGYQAPPPAAGYAGAGPPLAGYSSVGGGGYSKGAGGGYTSRGGYSEGGYSGAAAAAGATAAQVDEATETGAATEGAGAEPAADQVFHSPKEPCAAPQIKYIMLRSRKVPGSDASELVEEELEQVQHQAPHVEATASPLDAQIGDEIAAQEQASQDDGGVDDEDPSGGGDFKARGAKTAITDEKCNSKVLQKLVLGNISPNDALGSKKAIHEIALQQFPDSSVDVICSTTGFTYLVSTTEHCEAQKDGVICFVYKRPL